MQYQNYFHTILCASFSLFDWQQLASFVRRPCHAGDTFTVIRRKGGENWPLSQTFLHDSFPFLPLSPRPHPNTVVETSFKVNVGNMPPPSLPPACCPVLFWRGGEGERLILSVGTTQQGAFLAIVHCARPEVRYKCKSVGSRGKVGHRRCACCAGRDITFSSTTC